MTRDELRDLADAIDTCLPYQDSASVYQAETLRQIADAKPRAWLHVQGNHTEVAEREIDEAEKSRGWTQQPLYTLPLED